MCVCFCLCVSGREREQDSSISNNWKRSRKRCDPIDLIYFQFGATFDPNSICSLSKSSIGIFIRCENVFVNTWLQMDTRVGNGYDTRARDDSIACQFDCHIFIDSVGSRQSAVSTAIKDINCVIAMIRKKGINGSRNMQLERWTRGDEWLANDNTKSKQNVIKKNDNGISAEEIECCSVPRAPCDTNRFVDLFRCSNPLTNCV